MLSNVSGRGVRIPRCEYDVFSCFSGWRNFCCSLVVFQAATLATIDTDAEVLLCLLFFLRPLPAALAWLTIKCGRQLKNKPFVSVIFILFFIYLFDFFFSTSPTRQQLDSLIALEILSASFSRVGILTSGLSIHRKHTDWMLPVHLFCFVLFWMIILISEDCYSWIMCILTGKVAWYLWYSERKHILS